MSLRRQKDKKELPPLKAAVFRNHKRKERPREKRKRSVEPSKETVREQVRLLDGDWCLYCGRPGPGLHLHRVRYPRYRYTVDNCVLLCYEHHDLIHSSKRQWQPILLQHIAARRLREGGEIVPAENTLWEIAVIRGGMTARTGCFD